MVLRRHDRGEEDVEMTRTVLRYAAFTDDPAGGNPAGIVLDAAGLTDGQMLRIAADVGYSETAFVTSAQPAARRFTLRYFSPRAEVAFCGHATVATAAALGERLGTGRVEFRTQAGPIGVDVAEGPGGRCAVTFTSAPTTSRPAAGEAVDATLAALRWSRAELDPRFPPHVANAGVDHLLLAAATRSRLADLDYDFDALAAVMAARGWTTVHLFWAEDATTFHARNPFPPGGVVEDPATGAAAAAFGGYLRDVVWAGATPPAVTIHQGHDMGRPSTLRVGFPAGSRSVTIGGTAVPIG
jgi:PhzF family phenazine biosynthesis protein